MREGHFSGVPTLALEDSLVCLSAGPLRDRSVEYLAGVDAAIALLYRVLLKNARLAREGREPIGHGRSVTKLRGVNASLEPGSEWRRLVPDHEPARAPLRAAGASTRREARRARARDPRTDILLRPRSGDRSPAARDRSRLQRRDRR